MIQRERKKLERRIIAINDSNLEKYTKADYNSRLSQFFKFAGISETKEFLRMKKGELQDLLIEYAMNLNEKVQAGEISPNTVPKKFKPMKYLLDINYRENDIRWKPIKALWPKKIKLSGFKPWTTQQVGEMVEQAKTVRNRAFIHFMASMGGRIGIFEHPLLTKHLVRMSYNGQDCYAVLLYADQDETPEDKDDRIRQNMVNDDDYSYYGFLTPEATKWLNRYFRQRERDGEKLTDESPIFRVKYQSKYANDRVKQLTRSGAISLTSRILKQTSINREKKGRRFDVQLEHGFRKRFNTILKLESSLNSNIAEKIMGHKKGLDGTYLTPTREECFKEFCKAITELTVSEELRYEAKLQDKEKELTKYKNDQAREIQLMKEQRLDDKREMLKMFSDVIKNPEKLKELKKQLSSVDITH